MLLPMCSGLVNLECGISHVHCRIFSGMCCHGSGEIQ